MVRARIRACAILVVLAAVTATSVAFAQGGSTRKGFTRPKAPVNAPAPFLTEAVDHDIDTFSKLDTHLFVPTQRKVEQPFYDVPFAVNVPFEVPFDGGIVRVFFDVNIVWEEPERKAKVGTVGLFYDHGNWRIGSQGIYQLGGGTVPADSVQWQNGSDAHPMTAPTGLPFPVLIAGEVPTKRGASMVTTIDRDVGTLAPRPPFRIKVGENTRSKPVQPLVLRDAKPGSYAFWFTPLLELLHWPAEKLRPDDTLRAKIYVHTIVARRESASGANGYFDDSDHAWLWDGRDVKPARPLDPKLVHVHTVEIPLILRRDGWVFSHVEVRKSTDAKWEEKTLKQAEANATYTWVRKPSGSAASSGFTGSYEALFFERENRQQPWPVKPASATVVTWDVTLPREIPDGGVGAIEAKGTVKEEGSNADGSAREDWMAVRSTDGVRDPLGTSFMIERLNTSKDSYQQSWGPKLGDPNASKYFSSAGRNAPKKAGDVSKYWLFAKPFDANSSSSVTLGTRKIIAKDLGPQAIFRCEAGPFEVDCYYRRKKDLDKASGAPPSAGSVAIVTEKDAFWEWFVPFSRLLTEKMTDAQALMAQANVAITGTPELEARARRLIRAVITQGEIARANAASITDLVDAAKKLVDGEKKASFTPAMREAGRVLGQAVDDAASAAITQAMGTPPVGVEVSEAVFTRMTQEASRLTQEAQDRRKEAVRLMNEAMRCYEEIDAEMARGFDRYGERHLEILRWRNVYSFEKSLQRLVFAAAAKDPHTFREAVDATGLADIDPSIRLHEARLMKDNDDYAGAVFALRRVIAQTSRPAPQNPFLRLPGDNVDKDKAQLDPEHVAVNRLAELMLMQLECGILRTAAEKSQGALAEARKNFNGYLAERGFAEYRTGPSIGLQVLRGFVGMGGFDYLPDEDGWIVFTTGVTGILSGIMDKPGTEADKLGLYEDRMTAAYIGVHLMVQLRKRGLTLKQITNLNAVDLQKIVPLRRPGGTALPQLNVTHCRRAIQESLALPEVAALLSESTDELRRAFQKGYFSESDVTDTWVEWIGDFTSGKNLLLSLSGSSVGTVGGVTQGFKLWSAKEAEAIGALKAINATESGTVVMARVMGVQRALAAFRNTKSGEWVANQIIRAHGRYEQLGLIDRALWHGGKAVAGLALTGAAEMGAEYLGGKEGAFVVQMLIQFVGDEQMLAKFCYANGINPHVFAKLVHDGYAPMLRKQIRDLNSFKEEVGVWELIFAEMRKGIEPARMDKRMRIAMGKRYSLPAAIERTPAPNPGHNAQIALQGAAESAANGTDDGALAAARALIQDVERDARAQGVLLENVESLAAAVEKVPTVPLPRRGKAVLDFADDDAFAVCIPPRPAPGSKWAQIEQAIFDGRLKEAEDMIEDLFTAHRRAAESGQPLTKHELPGELWQYKRRIVKARVAQLKPPAMSVQLAAHIDDAELERALTMQRVTPAQYHNSQNAPAGSSGEVGFAIDGERKAHYVVKEVKYGDRLTKEHDLLQAMAEGEALTPDLLRMVGFEMPAARVKLFYGEDGKPVRALFVSRFVEGRLLNDLTPEESHALRAQLSGHSAASVWVGNYDRKGDNGIFTAEKRLVMIDAGQADPCGTRAGEIPVNHPSFMEGINGRDHMWRYNYNFLHSKDNPLDHPDTAKWFMVEQSLNYNEALPTVLEIKNLLQTRRGVLESRIRSRLKELFADSPMAKNPAEFESFIRRRVTATLDTLDDKADRLDEVMQGLNMRNQIAMPNGMKIPEAPVNKNMINVAGGSDTPAIGGRVKGAGKKVDPGIGTDPGANPARGVGVRDNRNGGRNPAAANPSATDPGVPTVGGAPVVAPDGVTIPPSAPFVVPNVRGATPSNPVVTPDGVTIPPSAPAVAPNSRGARPSNPANRPGVPTEPPTLPPVTPDGATAPPTVPPRKVWWRPGVPTQLAA